MNINMHEQNCFKEKKLESQVEYNTQIYLSKLILNKLNPLLSHTIIGLESKLKRKLRIIQKYRNIKLHMGILKFNKEYNDYYLELNNNDTYQILPNDINYMLENNIEKFLNKKYNYTLQIHQKLTGKVIYAKLIF